MKLITIYNKSPRDYTISVSVDIVRAIDGIEVLKGASRGKGYSAYTLTSGENVIPEKMYNYIKDVKFFKELVDYEYLKVEIKDVDSDVQVDNVEDKLSQVKIIQSLKASEAVDVISGGKGKDGLLDIQVLSKLKDVTDHKTVQIAIDKQIAKLTKTAK